MMASFLGVLVKMLTPRYMSVPSPIVEEFLITPFGPLRAWGTAFANGSPAYNDN